MTDNQADDTSLPIGEEGEDGIHIEETIFDQSPAENDRTLLEEVAEEIAAVSDDEGVALPEDATEEPALSLEQQLEQWKDIAARSRADLENYRKRMARDKQEAIQYANRRLLESLLPIIDNFEMGLSAARDTAEGESSVIYQGMAMVYKQIEDFLSSQDLTPVDSDGQTFDPNLHEAIKQEASDTVPEGQILFTMRRGYRLKDRLIRAANVVVSSGPEGS